MAASISDSQIFLPVDFYPRDETDSKLSAFELSWCEVAKRSQIVSFVASVGFGVNTVGLSANKGHDEVETQLASRYI